MRRLLLEAVQAQRAAGIMTVVSATNEGSSCSTISDPPAIYAEAYTVGALNTGTDTIAGFSSRGPVTSDGSNRRKPDIAAPGTSIRSSTRDGDYGYMQRHVDGRAACGRRGGAAVVGPAGTQESNHADRTIA